MSHAIDAAWLTDPDRRAALVVAHPAHEIRVLHWLSLVRPRTYILTQGSRSGADTTRRRASERLIESRGAHVAAWAGAWDRDIYNMLLEGVHSDLLKWTDDLAADFIARETDLVVADSWQLYNVAHDITYVIAHLAAERAARALGRAVTLLTYPVVSPALAAAVTFSPPVATLHLGAAAIGAKRAAINVIPDIALEAAEIDRTEGELAHTHESFHAPVSLAHTLRTPSETPLYERFGEDRVRAGTYFEVVRWAHVQAACDALLNAAPLPPALSARAPRGNRAHETARPVHPAR